MRIKYIINDYDKYEYICTKKTYRINRKGTIKMRESKLPLLIAPDLTMRLPQF
jgi:hypothetical protein